MSWSWDEQHDAKAALDRCLEGSLVVQWLRRSQRVCFGRLQQDFRNSLVQACLERIRTDWQVGPLQMAGIVLIGSVISNTVLMLMAPIPLGGGGWAWRSLLLGFGTACFLNPVGWSVLLRDSWCWPLIRWAWERFAGQRSISHGISPQAVRVLYITYDGLAEPLGQSQVLAYLESLSARGVRVVVVSFEQPPRSRQDRIVIEQIRRHTKQRGIRWVALRYHKSPIVLATAWDVLWGTVICVWMIGRHRIQIVHARSYVAALIAWWVKQILQRPFIFDMRGFLPDERVEGGIWTRESLAYRLAKRWERRFLDSADVIVSLTAAGRAVLEHAVSSPGITAPIVVIPTCVDLERFVPRPPDPQLAQRLGVHRMFRVIYHGNLGSWYLPDEMFRFFAVLKRLRPEAHLILLTPTAHDLVHERLAWQGVSRTDVTVRQVPFSEIPAWLSLAHLGMMFINPVSSKRASCPTKFAEYLASGIPVIVNAGIGDLDAIIRTQQVGVLISRFDQEGFAAGAVEALRLFGDAGLADRCRRVAVRRFSLTEGVTRYHAIYQRLTTGHESQTEPVVLSHTS